jgi:hypothetical protein
MLPDFELVADLGASTYFIGSGYDKTDVSVAEFGIQS